MATRRAQGITRQHAESISDVIAWIRAQPDTDPLAIGVLEDVRERVEQRAKQGALFRVRLMNHPNPRRPRRAPATADQSRKWGDNWEWSVEELDRLRSLFDAGMVFEEIAERIEGRSPAACKTQAHRMGLRRVRVYRSCFPQVGAGERKPPRLVRYNTGGPLTRAKEVMHARRMREARERQDGLEVAS